MGGLRILDAFLSRIACSWGLVGFMIAGPCRILDLQWDERVASALHIGRGLCGVIVHGLCGRDILELDG